MNAIDNVLNKPSSAYPLAVFRIFFGFLLCLDVCRIYKIKLIDSFYPRGVVFHYDLNLPLVGQSVFNLILLLLFLATVGITLGVFYKWCMGLFVLLFSYFFFLDMTLYNNHLYLIILIGCLMTFMPADAVLSLNKKTPQKIIAYWPYFILKFQIILVYLFGGISKLNPFWLDLHPAKELLLAKANASGLEFLQTVIMQNVVAYGGLFFDLFIGFLLLYSRTRYFAFIMVVAFNILNAYLFNDIYIFPFFMIGTLVLFADEKHVENYLKPFGFIRKNIKKEPKVLKEFKMKNTFKYLLFAYMIFQCVVPLRHLFIPGYTDWTGDAHFFSWRMKIQHRDIKEMQFAIFDTDNKVIHKIEPNKLLFPDEIVLMANSPQMIVLFAEYLKDEIAPKNGIANCEIKSKIKVSFNGLEPCYIFDPDVDLIKGSQVNNRFYTWVNKLPNN